MDLRERTRALPPALLIALVTLALAACGAETDTSSSRTDTVDVSVAVDLGPQPADVPAQPDLAPGDIGEPDNGPPDTGPPDVVVDAGEPDTETPDVGPADVGKPDVPAPTDDGPPVDTGECVPDCGDRVCGLNNCGELCGFCPHPKVCDEAGQCVAICVIECEGKFCGGDGCGGACGTCPEGLDCGDDGVCYEPSCEPDCLGKVCGADGCGGDCGVCVDPEICNAGACGLGPCGAVGAGGQCVGNTAVWCVDGDTLVEDNCDQYAEHHCKYDGWFNQYLCQEIGDCVPQCEGKQCGSDTCGGGCGVCSDGWACVQGACQPQPGGDCGAITALGQCIQNTLWFCSNGKLNTYACPQGETCGWHAVQQSFDCL